MEGESGMSLYIWLTIDVDTGGDHPYSVQLFNGNMTHNVTPMWRKAKVYEALYESQGKIAGEIKDVLQVGIKDMERSSKQYQKLNPANEWGDYDSALNFLREFTNACIQHPKATIGLSK
jgi:hypothetical protein